MDKYTKKYISVGTVAKIVHAASYFISLIFNFLSIFLFVCLSVCL